MWFSVGPLVSPAAGVVLADTGPVPGGGTVPLKIILTASALETALVQHRNAANTVTLVEFTLRVPANDSRSLDLGSLTIAGDERIRMVQSGAATGNVHAMIAQE